ncbi:MAG: tape measure protein, partial [Bacteroidales bacterium]|nr:tape measure protein [Bacteroidales bacterium]
MKRVGIVSESTYERMIKKQNDLDKSTSNFGSTIKRVFGTYLGFQAVKSITNLTAEMQSLTNSINFISGSSAEADKNLSFLRKMSNDLGLDLMSTYEGFKTLTGGFKGSKTTMEAQRDIFYQVSTAVTSMGLSAERARLVNLALGQIASKGVVSMEELRQQLGESLPGAFAIAAKAMGMTVSEFNKAVAAGRIMSEDFLPKFAKQMETDFSGGLNKATSSLRANLNRWNNAFLNIKLVIGEMLVPVISRLTGFIQGLSVFIQEHSEQIRGWIKWSLIIGGSLWTINKAMKVVTLSTALFSASSYKSLRSLVLLRQGLFWSTFNSAAYAGSLNLATLATNAFRAASLKMLVVIRSISAAIMSIPVVGWIIAGITGIILLFQKLWNSSEKFRGILYGIAEVAKEVFSGFNENIIKPFVNGIIKAFNWVKNIFTGIYEFIRINIVDKLKNVFSNLFDFLKPLFEGFANVVSFIFKPIIDLWNRIFPKASIAFNKGYAKGVKSFRMDKAGLSTTGMSGVNDSIPSKPGDPLFDSMSKGSQNITEGGSRPTNVNV